MRTTQSVGARISALGVGRSPARVAREDAHPFHHRAIASGSASRFHHHHRPCVPQPRHAVAPEATRSVARQKRGVPPSRARDEHRSWLGRRLASGKHVYPAVSLGRFSTTQRVPPSLCSPTVESDCAETSAPADRWASRNVPARTVCAQSEEIIRGI